MNRNVVVHTVLPGGGLHGPERQQAVSTLDLPPALVFHVFCDGEDLWVTDPVELARYCRRHPEALVEILGTERLKTAH